MRSCRKVVGDYLTTPVPLATHKYTLWPRLVLYPGLLVQSHNSAVDILVRVNYCEVVSALEARHNRMRTWLGVPTLCPGVGCVLAMPPAQVHHLRTPFQG